MMRRSRREKVTLMAALGSGLAFAICQPGICAAVDATNWGWITAPVYDMREAGVYQDAELFAGPNKLGANYFQGVLPNGRIVRPAGISVQVGMNPLGAALTPDGKYLITTNDDERDAGLVSLLNPVNVGGYSLSVVDTATMKVVSQIKSDKVFVGVQASGAGPYAVWASGGASNSVKLFSLSTAGAITGPTATIAIPPITPGNAGYVSNYAPDAAFNTKDANGNLPPAPSGFDRMQGAQTTFPAGSALSPDGRFLYVACNGDNSLAVIDTSTQSVVKQLPAGYFPYGVTVSADGHTILVSNWGVTAYKFAHPAYDPSSGKLTALTPTGQNQPDGFYVPPASTAGANPLTSSVSLFTTASDPSGLAAQKAVYLGRPLDALEQVGDTHPSATAIVRRGTTEVLYVARANDDSLGLIRVSDGVRLPDLDLSPVRGSVLRIAYPTKTGAFGRPVSESEYGIRNTQYGAALFFGKPQDPRLTGAYPNALAVSPDNQRVYVAEAGLNTVAVLDTSDPTQPKLLGYIPTGWYPTTVTISPDGHSLYVVNAKGIGEDTNAKTVPSAGQSPTGLESFQDSNFIFGSVQKIDLTTLPLDPSSALQNDYAVHAPADTSIVPAGGGPSARIKHVFFILHENKTFDSMLGNHADHFGPYASTTFNNADGSAATDPQFTGVSLNTQLLAVSFAAAVNYYSESEESDAGHQFCASGTASDYTEKTLLVKSGRGLLVNKNFEPEDYPAGGYLFNNAARHGVDFKDYGALIRIVGTDTGSSTPTKLSDPPSGMVGYPKLADAVNITQPLANLGDVTTLPQGLGQSYFMAMPVLAILGDTNNSGEAHLDRNYPGYNFNISDQRRALEFNQDFDQMVQKGTLPNFLYIYQPNDHTGGVQAPNQAAVGSSPAQQVADGDVALGMVVNHIMRSKAYYDPATGDGSAIFITYDDAQSTRDHIHEHRTPLVVVSPYAKEGFIGTRHYSTASVVKTEELLLGLPPNNLGDLFATDLRDLFQPTYNGITADSLTFNPVARYTPSPEGKRIWALVCRLDTAAPDRDSRRLGALARLSLKADGLHRAAARRRHLRSRSYKDAQTRLYQMALQLAGASAPRDASVMHATLRE
jgi:YVTN family beta-propeller protein